MKTKMSNLGIFIISHNRADTLKTYKTLKNAKCEKDIFIVIDDLDNEIDKYKEKYDNVLIFDKKKYFKLTDNLINKEELRNCVFARNACLDFAEEKGYKYFAVLDDDINSFDLRMVKHNKLKSLKVNKIDEVLDAMTTFLDNSNADSICFADSSFYFGGLSSDRYQEGVPRGCYQAMIMRTDSDIKFYGNLNEDIGTTIVEGMRGKLMFLNMLTSIATPKRGTNEGGLHEVYEAKGDYERSFYTFMLRPDIVKIKNDYKCTVSFGDYAFPKIINERYKLK